MKYEHYYQKLALSKNMKCLKAGFLGIFKYWTKPNDMDLEFNVINASRDKGLGRVKEYEKLGSVKVRKVVEEGFLKITVDDVMEQAIAYGFTNANAYTVDFVPPYDELFYPYQETYEGKFTFYHVNDVPEKIKEENKQTDAPQNNLQATKSANLKHENHMAKILNSHDYDDGYDDDDEEFGSSDFERSY